MNIEDKRMVNNIFITGATGVMGARLLLSILTTTDAMVYCLCRAKNHQTAMARIDQIIDVYDVDNDTQDQRWRLIPVLGDVCQDKFGLQEDDYNELAESCDLAFHCAASVNLVASFDKLKPINVDGTARMIEFCLLGNIPLVHTSSFSVIGDYLYHDVVLKENCLDIGQKFKGMNYERSKFESEKLLHAASKRGLQWSIVRPGNIWGDSRTGAYPLYEVQLKGIYYEIIKSLVETGFTYGSDEIFDVSPVDYVAESALYIGLNIEKALHQTFHLTSRNPITFNDLVGLVRGYGYTIREIDAEEYFTSLHESRMLKNGKTYRSSFTDLLLLFYDEEDLVEKGRWDTSCISRLLEGTPVNYPEFNQGVMNRYLDYSVDRGWIPSVADQPPLAEISGKKPKKHVRLNIFTKEGENEPV